MEKVLFICIWFCSIGLKAQVQTYLYEQNGLKVISLDTNKTDAKVYLEAILNNSTVKYVQVNEPLQRRQTPNGPLFFYQTYLRKAELNSFWTKYTGGLTRNKDTIIVAIIDDGIDTTHSDLINNIHINHKEIKWNGIDDDGNGYIDDYYGWNGADSNGKVTSYYKSEHGTPIAGIIGAQGNNGIGITGINWNVKLLNLVSYNINSPTGDDITIANCFEYILSNKRLYKYSQGQNGINTAILSLSVGKEYAFAKDNPMWCSYLDSFAQYGIIVTAAAPNNTYNVDQFGDMPSNCPSRNLIVATSADNGINKGASGPINIDLAANGQQAYSTSSAGNSQYSYFNGTSFAGPQVAGVAALLLQSACENYLQLLQVSTAQAIELMRNWILHTDTFVSLSKAVATSGELNGRRVLQAMDQWCMNNDVTYNTKRIKSLRLQAFPNPIKSGETLFFNLPSGPKSIEIISLSGQQLHQTTGWENQIKLPNLVPGVYMVKAQYMGDTYFTKILVF